MVSDSTLKSLEMWRKLIKIFTTSHRIYLWQVIAVLFVAMVLILHSLHTSEKRSLHISEKQSLHTSEKQSLHTSEKHSLHTSEKQSIHTSKKQSPHTIEKRSLNTSEKLRPHIQAERVPGSISDVIKAVKWMELPNKMENLNENPVYAKFNTSRKEKPSKVNLLIIVSSAPKRSDRRLAIRETWWQQCRSTKRVSGHLFSYPRSLERSIRTT